MNSPVPPTISRKDFLSRPEIVTEINRMMRTRSRSTLVSLCTTAGVVDTGSKHDLATRLVMVEHKIMEPKQSMMDRIRKTQPSIILTQLPDGHFWYKEASLVFHKDTRKVFKRCVSIDPEPQYLDLDRTALDYCREYKILYQMPETIVESTKEWKDDGINNNNNNNNNNSNNNNNNIKESWRPALPTKIAEEETTLADLEVDIEGEEDDEVGEEGEILGVSTLSTLS